ncbi:MAG: protein translocase subunit SecF [Candidatus Obscuribacterales bacterium]|nr:protein translocase subunit SecF [Candidatus Obscuribacterales bacterium]
MKSIKVDIVKYRWTWFGISALLTLPGVVGIILCYMQFNAPLKPGIDFTGGSILQYQFEKPLDLDQVRHVLEEVGLHGSQAQKAFISQKEVIVMRTRALDDEGLKKRLDTALEAECGKFQPLSVDKVTATIGPELLANGLIALFATLGMMVAYISYRYQFDYALCAIAALFHDVIVLCGFYALFGIFLGTEVDSLFISAVLTVIGFSVHDTIVVFDRIRENAKLVGSKIKDTETGKERKKTFGDVANDSVNQTLARSIYTSLTVVFTLTALYLWGGSTTKDFVFAMLIGIISGTYSSIFNASCLLAYWREVAAKRPVKPVVVKA